MLNEERHRTCERTHEGLANLTPALRTKAAGHSVLLLQFTRNGPTATSFCGIEGRRRLLTSYFTGMWRMWAALSAALMLAIAPFALPIGYYTAMRWLVCIVAIALVRHENTTKGVNAWVFGLVGVAVLFNPLVPIHLTRALWMPIDIVCTVVFLVHSAVTFVRNRRTREG
jgi:hypothetical protein